MTARPRTFLSLPSPLRLLVALIAMVAGIASGATLGGAETAVAANNIETAAAVEADANIPAGHVGSEPAAFDDWTSGCCVAPNTPGSPDIMPSDVTGKTRTEIRQLADDKGLVPRGQPDPIDGLPRKWDDPVTGEHRLRLDRGHVDKQTGLPYNNPRAASDHCHLYTAIGTAVGDPLAGGDKHFPTNGC